MNPISEVIIGTSVWSVVLRGVIWLGLVILLAYGADEGYKKSQIKNQVGIFFLFLTMTGILAYLVFGVSFNS